MDLLRERIDARIRRCALPFERRTVHIDARLLHRREYGDERQLHILIERQEARLRERGLQGSVQTRGKLRLTHGSLLIRKIRGCLRGISAQRKCCALDITPTLLRMKEIVSQLEVKGICTDRKSCMHVALCVPKDNGALRKQRSHRIEMRRPRAYNSACIPIDKGKRFKAHKRSCSAEYGTDGDLLRRTECLHVRGIQVRRHKIGHGCCRVLCKEGLLHRGRSSRSRFQVVRQRAPDRAQFVFPAERLKRTKIRPHAKILRLITEFRHIAFNCRKCFREKCLIAVFDQRGAELFPADFRCMIENILDAPVCDQQFRGGLWPDARHARDIIRTVAHQPLHIDEASRHKSVLLLKHRSIIRLHLTDALFRQHDREMRTNELQRIAVARHDGSLCPLICRLRTERADNVVRLVMIALQERNPEGLCQLFQQRDLRGQLLRRLIPRSLVVRIDFCAECCTALVKGNDNLLRRKLFQQLHQHHGKAVHRIRMDAARIRRQLQSIERTEKETAPVQDCKLCLHRRGISSFSRRIRIKR